MLKEEKRENQEKQNSDIRQGGKEGLWPSSNST